MTMPIFSSRNRMLSAVLLLAGCAPGEAPPAAALRADALLSPVAPGDTTPSAIARKVLGEEARRAVAFRAGGKDFIAAVRDMAVDGPDPVDRHGSASRYAYEVVVLERRGAEWVAHAPGIYAFDEQDHARRVEVDGRAAAPDLGPPRDLDLLWGMADVDGDGDVEPWAASVLSGASAFSIDLRAYDPVTRDLHRFQAPSTERPERLDHARAELSPGAVRSPAGRRWLAARADSVIAAWMAATLDEP
jgi:hypothetical protein